MYVFYNLLVQGDPVHLVNGQENDFSVYPNDENLFVGTRGWFHSHFADPDSAGLIFSAGDLNMLAEQVVRDAAFFKVNYRQFMIGVVADSNAHYILMVEDIDKFTAWATMLFQDQKIIEAAYLGARLSQKFLPISVNETEKRFLKVIQNAGLRLLKGNNDFTNWTGIKLDNTGSNVITTGACNTINLSL
jgi:hypothetical protein